MNVAPLLFPYFSVKFLFVVKSVCLSVCLSIVQRSLPFMSSYLKTFFLPLNIKCPLHSLLVKLFRSVGHVGGENEIGSLDYSELIITGTCTG